MKRKTTIITVLSILFIALAGINPAAAYTSEIQTQSILDQFAAKKALVQTVLNSAAEKWVDIGVLESSFNIVNEKVDKIQALIELGRTDEASVLAKEVQSFIIETDIQSLKNAYTALLGDPDPEVGILYLTQAEAKVTQLILMSQQAGLDTTRLELELANIQSDKAKLEAISSQNLTPEEEKAAINEVYKGDAKRLVDYYLQNHLILQYQKRIRLLKALINGAESLVVKAESESVDASRLQIMIAEANVSLTKAETYLENHNSIDEIKPLIESVQALSWHSEIAKVNTAIYESSLKTSIESSLSSAKESVSQLTGELQTLREQNIDTAPVANAIIKLNILISEAEAKCNSGEYAKCAMLIDNIVITGTRTVAYINRQQERLNISTIDTIDFTSSANGVIELTKIYGVGAKAKIESALSAENRNAALQLLIEKKDAGGEVILSLSGDAQAKFISLLSRVPEDKKTDLLLAKETMLSQASQLKDHLTYLRENRLTTVDAESKLLSTIETLENQIVIGGTATQIESKIDTFIAETSQMDARSSVITAIGQLETDIAPLIKTAAIDKYNAGINSFKDVEGSEWFSSYVEYVKANNIVSGYKDAAGNLLGEYRPAEPVSIAEVLKMVLEASGYGQADGTTINYLAVGHWAQGYVVQAEAKGLSIASTVRNIDQYATRGEVVRLILEVFDIEPAETADAFYDIQGNKNANHIQKAVDLGIVAGNPDGTFRPDDKINRAEMAKVMKNTIEILKKPKGE